MATLVQIPELGDAQNVEVIELCVAVGDVVEEGSALIVLESDKASMEVPAPSAGTILAIAVAEGDTVAEGQPLCEIDSAQAESAAPADAGEAVPQARPEAGAAGPDSDTAYAEPPPAATEPVTEGDAVVVDVRVPDIGDAADVTVVEVCVQVDAVTEEDTTLVVLESDKASMEVPAGIAGTILAVAVSEGDSVGEGSLLAQIAGAAAQGVPVPEPTPAETFANPSAGVPVPATAPAPVHQSVSASSPDRVYAGPAVRRLARELGVDLSEVNASGARGRVVKEDVQAFVKQRMQGTAAPAGGASIEPVPIPDFARFGPVEIEPLSRVQKAGARNLHRSWVNLPHVTHHDEVDVTDLEAFRSSLRDEGEVRGVRMTPLAFLIKACVAALKEHPRFNASLDAAQENYVLKQYYNIGIAVDTPHGLVVPVVRGADQKGLWELAAEIADLALRARDLKLRPEEMQGGTFSISSLGALGGTAFTPIINAPEVAILGVARTAIKPQWTGSEFEPRSMMPLSLSYDHRAINGADGARFTGAVMRALADVRRLAL